MLGLNFGYMKSLVIFVLLFQNNLSLMSSAINLEDDLNSMNTPSSKFKKPHFLRNIVYCIEAKLEARKVMRSLEEVKSIKSGGKKVITLDEFLETF